MTLGALLGSLTKPQGPPKQYGPFQDRGSYEQSSAGWTDSGESGGWSGYPAGMMVEGWKGGGGGWSGGGGGWSGGGGGWSGGGGGGGGWKGGGGGGWKGGGGGWKGGGGGWSKGHDKGSSAALSALTLLSFLFFLNLLQSQLLTRISPALLVVNTTARRFERDVGEMARGDPAELSFEGDDVPTGDYDTIGFSDIDIPVSKGENFPVYFATTEEKVAAPSLVEQDNLATTVTPESPLLKAASKPPPELLGEALRALAGLLARNFTPRMAKSLSRCKGAVGCALHRHSRDVGGVTNPVQSLVIRFLLGGDGDEICSNPQESSPEAEGFSSAECGAVAGVVSAIVPLFVQPAP